MSQNESQPYLPFLTNVVLFGTRKKERVLNWLDEHVGSRELDWTYEVVIIPNTNIVEQVGFACHQDQLMFEIAWSELCTK